MDELPASVEQALAVFPQPRIRVRRVRLPSVIH